MPEIVPCPTCGRRLTIPEEYAGRQVECPSCAARFTATLPQAVLPADRNLSNVQANPPLWTPQALERPTARTRHFEDDDQEMPPAFRRDYQPHRGSAVLTLGILSLIVCHVILGPIAWSMGAADLRKMREGQMDPSGEGVTRAGMICGIIATCLFVGTLVLVFLFAMLRQGRM